VVDVESNSLDNLIEQLKSSLSLGSGCRYEYWDPDFEEFAEIDNIDVLGNKAKMRIVPPADGEAHPWEFDAQLKTQTAWVSKGYAQTPYRSLLIQDGSSVYFPLEMEKVRHLLSTFHNGPSLSISKVYAIDNKRLAQDVESYMLRLTNKHRAAPNIFTSNTWQTDRFSWRQWVLKPFEEMTHKCPWNTSLSTPVVCLLQGTSEEVVWQICQTGYAVVATRDDGWYGRGIYFTSSAQYAMYYAKQNTQGEKILTLNFLVPGAIYPVIEDPRNESESLVGRPCQKGHQSHYARVNTQLSPQFGYPAVENTQDTYDELVVFQESQVVLKYVLFVKA